MNARILQEAAVRYFLEVVNTGSISDAASRLHVVPSAISRQIGRLESELNVTLFERCSRGMVPSKAGAVLAAYARRSLLDAEQVSAEIEALRCDAAFTIRIACTEGFVADFLPQAMADFRCHEPRVQFELSVDSAAGVTQRVRQADADIGFTFSLGPSADIEAVYSMPSPVLAVVGSAHPLASAERVSFRELLAYPLAIPAANSTLRKLIDIYCSRKGVACKSVLMSETLEALLRFTAASDAITFCGELVIRTRLAEGRLIALPVPELNVSDRSIEVQTLARRQIPPLMRGFLDLICRALPPSGALVQK
jgi:DNA-binding transcriptional LysR family regulator